MLDLYLYFDFLLVAGSNFGLIVFFLKQKIYTVPFRYKALDDLIFLLLLNTKITYKRIWVKVLVTVTTSSNRKMRLFVQIIFFYIERSIADSWVNLIVGDWSFSIFRFMAIQHVGLIQGLFPNISPFFEELDD